MTDPAITDSEIKKPNFRWANIDELKPYPNNSRDHSEDQIRLLMHSLVQFGWRKSVAIEKGTNYIVAGHGIVEAARRLGLTRIPCEESDDTPENHRTYRVGDNKYAELSTWNDKLLNLELVELDAAGVNIGLTGFSDEELKERIQGYGGGAGLTDEDAVPEAPTVAKTKLGDLYILGEHRLLCGDSSNSRDIECVIGDDKIDLILTDPPYGIKRDKGFEGFGGFGTPIARKKYHGDWDTTIPEKKSFDLLLSLSDRALIFGGNFFAHLLPQGKHWVVWDKNNTMPTFGDAELIWSNIKRDSVKIKRFEYNGLIGKEKEARQHATQKPVALIIDLLKDYSEENNYILDTFGGSGTTLIACEKINRNCLMMELDPIYCDVIVKRWEDFTGQKAELIPSPQPNP